ncbi:glycerophosphodiester phosphodiesterase [bacterium]|nr:glycerophosphodiester phosphodiesterase [bacterium]
MTHRLLIAHRGASFDAPENTLAAFRLAWEQNANAIEIDVHLSRDGRVAVIHDGDTKRIAGREAAVADQSWSELRKLDVGDWKGPEWTGERIPSFEEVLDALPDGKSVLVEIKSGPETVPALKKVLSARVGLTDRVWLQSFRPGVALAAREAFPDHAVFQLSDYKARPDRPGFFGQPQTIEFLIDLARENQLTGLALRRTPPLDSQTALALKSAGLRLFYWTVDDPDEACALMETGADGLITNRPGLLRQTLHSCSS